MDRVAISIYKGDHKKNSCYRLADTLLDKKILFSTIRMITVTMKKKERTNSCKSSPRSKQISTIKATDKKSENNVLVLYYFHRDTFCAWEGNARSLMSRN